MFYLVEKVLELARKRPGLKVLEFHIQFTVATPTFLSIDTEVRIAGDPTSCDMRWQERVKFLFKPPSVVSVRLV